ncbi:MAG: replicative DNA helicase [Coriobacteriales bacterium]|jgi:replicative DNA helicase|nr:replicative DNA helicase [Coriobacteriales bacterium]
MSDAVESISAGKTPPHNLDAERAVLAAMILDKEIVEDVLVCITCEAFYRDSHQKIFSAMFEMSKAGTPIDQLTLADKLEALGQLEQVGGKPYILELANNSYALANWASHVQIVKNDALLRALTEAAVKIGALGYSKTDDADNAIEQAERLLFNVTDRRVASSFTKISESLSELQKTLEEMQKNKSKMQGVPTGFKDLDNLLAGMRAGDLIILAARPGVGKTSLALNIAINAAKRDTAVAFFSLEMPAQQLTQRVLASEANVESSRLRTGFLQPSDWKDIIAASEILHDTDFSIDDSPSLTIMELRTKARRQLRNAERGKGLVVVDYLQLMSSSGAAKDRHLEVGEISRGLKILAKELEVPVMALSQLNRSVESRGNKRPQLADLRESGSIEQDADVVMFIDRSLSEEEASSSTRPAEGVANLIIGKNRNGALRDIEMVFIPSTTTFRDCVSAEQNANYEQYMDQYSDQYV